jgi:hypothetical protein
MWHDLIHGFSSANDSATDLFTTSGGFEFHVTPTALCPQASMMVFMFLGICVIAP